MQVRLEMCAASLVGLLVAVTVCLGDDGPGDGAAATTVVLDTTSFWRVTSTLGPPVIQTGGGLTPILHGPAWLDRHTPEPPDDWTAPDFDDRTWLRGPALVAPRTPYLARLYLRGAFTVTDPRRVKDLAVSVRYHGGAVVTVNGKEIGRGHLPKGKVGPETLAEPYPRDVYVTEAGKLLAWDRRHVMPTGDTGRRVAMRQRSLDRVAVPASLLRKGRNVVAVQLVRAPYHKVLTEIPGPKDRGRQPYDVNWNSCEMWQVQVTAATAHGLVPGAVRPNGFQVWNADVLTSDFDLDFANPAEPLRPIRIVAARNGTFSGKVVAGSTQPLRGLRATMSNLTSGDATIPASAVRVRYAFPWGYEAGTTGLPYARYPRGVSLLEGLAESPPAESPIRGKPAGRRDFKTPGQPEPVFGAVVPVWVSVTVPKGAAPGVYRGRLSVAVQGVPPVAVPVELDVADWTLPEPRAYRTWVELMQSPDTLAMEYGLTPWSDEHFKLIDRSMALLSEVGSRVVYVPLICETNLGNAESMVRWIEKGQGRFEYDFSVMDRYLDVAEKHMGKPLIVCFNVWDVYINAKAKSKNARRSGEARALAYLKQKGAPLGEGPLVTVLDPATKKAQTTEVPLFTDPESKALWGPLMAQLRQRLSRRGLDDAMALGIISDAWPSKEEVAFFKELAPDVPWVSHSHHGIHGRGPLKVHGLAACRYQTRVWHVYHSSDPAKPLYGWKGKDLVAEYNRSRGLNALPPTKWLHINELTITGSQRGMGRIGADYWPVIKDKNGKRVATIALQYPQSSWRNLDLYTSLLAPGPEGPAATARFEVFREGVEDCEARIVIEQALSDEALKDKLGPDLLRRCQDMLTERTLRMWMSQSNLQLTGPIYLYATQWRTRAGVAGHYWFAGTDWQRRRRTLYELAGQVATRLGTN